jgi:hypothetical protein
MHLVAVQSHAGTEVHTILHVQAEGVHIIVTTLLVEARPNKVECHDFVGVVGSSLIWLVPELVHERLLLVAHECWVRDIVVVVALSRQGESVGERVCSRSVSYAVT